MKNTVIVNYLEDIHGFSTCVLSRNVAQPILVNRSKVSNIISIFIEKIYINK